MRSIAQRILNAEVPVVVYVAPTGARAASAGAFITLAGHVAAMAPATNIGAAHPVAVGGGMDKESLRKIENDAAAFIRTLALERGRNADWAEKAVRESVSVTEREALKLHVIDLVADSLPDLLEKVDGRTVKTTGGAVTLATRGVQVIPVEVGLRDRFLNVISDPNIAYILMMLGILGLFFELSNPGVIAPGIMAGEEWLAGRTAKLPRVAFRPPSTSDLHAITSARDVEDARRMLVARCVLSAEQDGSPIAASLLPDPVIEEMGRAIESADPTTELRLRASCPACSYEWEAPFDVASFLWEEIGRRAHRLLGEIHALAGAYGWSEAEILALPEPRRSAYLELVLA